MSALTRGIVLGQDGAKLIVEAKPEDVARYTVGEAVALLAEQGYRLQQRDRYVMLGARPTHVIARLRTACGCEKEMAVRWPPPPVVRSPIARPLRALDLKDIAPHAVKSFGVRDFDFVRMDGDDPGVAFYYERVE